MQIYISFDYELFFGKSSGTAQKCILEPTQKLLEIANKHNVSFVFFVDAGYLWQLKNNLHHSFCKIDFDKISIQLKKIVALGHEIALHVHPHWEDCKIENDAWKISTSRYKLANFSGDEIEQIITKYHQTISEIIQQPCKSYRAGGWCVQPFTPIKNALAKNSIFTDSSVYYKGFHDSNAHSYNFLNAPNKSSWNFENDPCLELEAGQFKEIAISYDKIPPLFYWNLYLKMKSNPATYKPVGDGNWLVDKKRVYKHFYASTNHFACTDGYFASRLPKILKKLENQQHDKMMILSHPKSMAEYSFKALDNFIKLVKKKGHHVCRIS